MVLPTGLRQSIAFRIVRITPFYFIGASPESYVTLELIYSVWVLYRAHFHVNGDLVTGIIWHTGLMQQGLLADACCSECQRGGFGSV